MSYVWTDDKPEGIQCLFIAVDKCVADGAIEGELKATKIHLEDLRQLLKITKRTP